MNVLALQLTLPRAEVLHFIGYRGGASPAPSIDALAKEGDPKRFPLPVSLRDRRTYDFSFYYADSMVTARGVAIAAGESWLVDAELPLEQPGRVCTLVGCGEGVSVSLQPPLPLDRAYRIELRADDETVTCEVAPQPGGDDSCLNYRVITCSDPQVEAFGLHCDSIDLRGLSMPRFPKQVQLTITLERARVFHGTAAVSYEQIHPNGADCDDGCRVGAVEFALPAPAK